MNKNFISRKSDDNFDVTLDNEKKFLTKEYLIPVIEEVIVSECRVSWDFDLECRSWGVKSFTCYALDVSLELLVEIPQVNPDDPMLSESPIEKFIDIILKEFELDTEVSEDFSGQFCVDDVRIDFQDKKITVYINN